MSGWRGARWARHGRARPFSAAPAPLLARRLATLLAALLAAAPIALPASADAASPARGAPGALLAAAAQHQEFYWDFSECFDLTVHSGGTEFVSGDRYGLPGGCFLRLGEPGQSWLEATFNLTGDPVPRGARGIWGLVIFHLAPSPDDRTRGNAPVQVTMNGQQVWSGSPADEGHYGPGQVWDSTQLDVTPLLQRGRNTLRWELQAGATSPYWLKTIYVAWEPG